MRRLSDERGITDVAEEWAESAPADRLSAWTNGVGLAILPAAYGLWCVAAKSAGFPARQGHSVEYHGPAAVALGIAYISLGFFLHFHYFWSSHERFVVVGQIGKPASLLVTAGAIGYFLFQVLDLG